MKNLTKEQIKVLSIIIVAIIVIVLAISIVSLVKTIKNKKIVQEASNINDNIVEEELLQDENDIEEESIENLEEVEAEKETEQNNSNTTTSSTSNSSKSSSNKYYIKVNYTANVVTIYTKDDNGEYTVPYKAMICSTGTATPKSGVYAIKSRWRWLSLIGGVYGQYSTQIVGNILFHSVPYLSKSQDSLEYWEYDKLRNFLFSRLH